MTSRAFFFSLLALVTVNASPVEFMKRQNISTLTSAQVNAFTPFTHYASAAYCNPSGTLAWNCGANCQANPDFIPIASGGDGSITQYWYVGYSPAQNSVIVAHQGTDADKIIPLLTDGDIILGNLDPTLFPGIPSSMESHSGFRDAHARTATEILAAVNDAISQHSATKVTIVGHSLGCAIALLDGIYLPLHIEGVAFSTIGYGCPRVGNQAFADYVDSHISFTHINNKKDPAPIFPGRFLGYHQASGEIHITETGSWVSCPGQDNPSAECSVGDVDNVSVGDISDHAGPYNGIMMSC
ncbi:Lipase [Leucoagaricus sp. SymC.cos]|nr:Lipase [Leucoagaricus sp. SymC.cos]